ncbi:nicotinate-nucleotide adenylyltransferase [Massilia terrae]|uniref:Probable nicotinate-nucleotide adenylyltransferase n=1 Tax=Massilia terrae TaxID=1811224 RepID=A0ABT2CWM2_9BURK|nr:nicotinate-nucleotide adenylyltransferase [Massilia terrae]
MSLCIALLGGSFDPVHIGHVALAELFADLLQPDQLRIVPAGRPWQKSKLEASDADRVAMLECAFRGAPFPVTIDLQEVERKGATYTIDTLRKVRGELGPEASIVFLMGADQLQKLDTWREWQALFGIANIGVAARPGYELAADKLPANVTRELAPRLASPAEVRASPAGRVCLAHTLAVDISATAVRDAIRHGDSANDLVAPVVLDYIQQHHLYKS